MIHIHHLDFEHADVCFYDYKHNGTYALLERFIEEDVKGDRTHLYTEKDILDFDQSCRFIETSVGEWNYWLVLNFKEHEIDFLKERTITHN